MLQLSHSDKIEHHGVRPEMKTVIIPTLNEEKNISHLIQSIYEYMDEDLSVVVVDDNSEDGTQDIVKNLKGQYKTLQLVIRKHARGLGSAVRLGAKIAGPQMVVVMDADMSHNPKYLPAIFESLEKGNDIAVGSRHIAGGKIEGWPGSRFAISKVATTIAKLLFQVPVKDPMSGFVGCRSGDLLASRFEYANTKFLLEVLVNDRSLKVSEIPIIFQDRARGKSKLSQGTILSFLWLVLRLILR